MSTPAALRVRQCNIRLIRKAEDGVHWLDREDHIDFARRMRPLLLAMLEETVVPELEALGEHCGIDSLAIRLDLPAAELAGAAPMARATLRAKARDAVRRAVKEAQAAGPRGVSQVAVTQPRPAAPNPIDAPVTAQTATMLVRLAALEARGDLVRFIAQAGRKALTPIVAQLLRELAAMRTVASLGADIPATIDTANSHEPADELVAARSWVARLVAQFRDAEGQQAQAAGAERAAMLAEGRRLAERLLPRPSGSPRSAADPENDHPPSTLSRSAGRDALATQSPVDPGSDTDSPSAQRGEVASTSPPEIRPNGRYQVDCALPFLALLRLAHHGIFDLLDDGEAARALAYAIGLKAQAAPRPYKPRAPMELLPATLAAGCTEPLHGDDLHRASRNGEAGFELCKAALNSAMAPALLDAAILPVVFDRGAFVLVDSVGQFPAGGVAVAALDRLTGGRRPVLVLPPGEGTGLAQLAAVGWPAACEGRPARGEKLACITGPDAWRGMASGQAQSLAPWLGEMPRLSRAAVRAKALWAALTHERPLCPVDVTALDQAGALLTGFALADIAHGLSLRDPAAWADPDPLLAIERFADLPARIDCDTNEILVTLPLGRRFADLLAAGLIATQARLPWLGDRVLRVSGG